ncbi:hypothetical protein ACJJTC_010807 [Scirpophaga incertulas]
MDLSPDDDNFQGRLLHQAALWDNVELLEELLSSGAEVDARDGRRRTALHAAALADRSRCLHALCRAGADVNARADDAAGGKTALHIAAERGHVENVRVLLKAGADVDALDAAGETALSLAVANHWRHAALALRDHTDALERERLSQHAALRELVAAGDATALRARLLTLGTAAGLIVNLTPGGAHTLLYSAAEAGDAGVVAVLLEHGADGRGQAGSRYGPLHAAARRGHLAVARRLLRAFPAAVQHESVEKWLPLHAACVGGHAALVTLLLEYPYPRSSCNATQTRAASTSIGSRSTSTRGMPADKPLCI